MRKYSRKEFVEALHCCGLRQGDTVFVHSSLLEIGLLHDCPVSHIPGDIFIMLKEYLGGEGTIVVPSFNFAFAAGVPFERQHTPALAMGVFAEYVRRLPTSMRSSHPMESVCAVGPLAAEICADHAGSTFAAGGPFDVMLREKAVLLFLGASTGRASLAHYCEEKFHVPYRYWIDYTGLYVDRESICTQTFPMYVRNLKDYPQAQDFSVMEYLLTEAQLMCCTKLGGGKVKSCSFEDYVQLTMEKLSQNPLYLLKKPLEECAEKYIGDWKDGVPHGTGTYLWSGEREYNGDWDGGLMHGRGTFHFSDGTMYVGDYVRGKRHGIGVMTGPNGERYEGEWQNGMRHGQGTMVVPHEHKYTGEWEKGLKHGQGTLTWSGGGSYTGQWNKGKMDEEGSLYLSDGRLLK